MSVKKFFHQRFGKKSSYPNQITHPQTNVKWSADCWSWVLCHFNRLFPLDLQNEIQLLSRSSVIHGWFVYWVFGWEMRRLKSSKHREAGLKLKSARFLFITQKETILAEYMSSWIKFVVFINVTLNIFSCFDCLSRSLSYRCAGCLQYLLHEHRMRE